MDYFNSYLEYQNVNSDFENDINRHADEINDETLTEENASYISEVSTNEKSKTNPEIPKTNPTTIK